jgi:hypothetical protein
MGLPARQRRRLDGIEDKLCRSDPRLAAMFTMFGRLTGDEEMPRIEELAHRAAVLGVRIRLWLAAARTRLRSAAGQRAPSGKRPRSRSGSRSRRPARSPAGGRAGRWRPMAVFFPLALVLMSLSIFVAARFGSTPRCVATAAVATAKLNPKSKPTAKAGGSKASKSAKRCRPAMLTPIPMGR